MRVIYTQKIIFQYIDEHTKNLVQRMKDFHEHYIVSCKNFSFNEILIYSISLKHKIFQSDKEFNVPFTLYLLNLINDVLS